MKNIVIVALVMIAIGESDRMTLMFTKTAAAP